MKYVCPMHPEVTSMKPGKCPKCGMNLVKSGEVTQHTEPQNSYTPLFIIVGLITLVAATITYRTDQSLLSFISYFMAGFFITFAGFKLVDLRGFADGYSTYDLLAQKWLGYGYLYSFIELFFGLSMILIPHSKELLLAEFAIMAFSGIGVAIKIARKEKFQCACLGTFLKVPLTKVTLVEDFGMAILALIMYFSI